MYGMIHKAARELTIQTHGDEVWGQVLHKCQLDDAHFISGQYYCDEMTFKLIGELASQAGLPVPNLLDAFGQFWIKFVSRSVYGSVIDMTGNNLVSFITNLDRMHDSIRATMPEANLPSFKVAESSDSEIRVLYKSSRDGLESFVKGLLRGLMDKFETSGTISYKVLDEGVEFLIKPTVSV